MLETEINLSNGERTNLAKFRILTIHLNGSNAHLNHNVNFNEPLVELGHNYASEHPDIFVKQDKFNINNLREWPLDMLDDYGFPRHSLMSVPKWYLTTIGFLYYFIRTM